MFCYFDAFLTESIIEKNNLKSMVQQKCSIILELNDRSCRITNASIMKYSICRNCCYSAWIAKLSETIKYCWFIIKDILTTLRIEIDVPGIVLIFWKMSLLFNLQKKNLQENVLIGLKVCLEFVFVFPV